MKSKTDSIAKFDLSKYSCQRCGSRVLLRKICECHTNPSSILDQAVQKNKKKLIVIYGALSGLFLLLYFHISYWGAYAFQAPLLKAKSVVGSLKSSEYLELAKACSKLGHEDCVKDTYVKLFSKNKNLTGLALLAQLESHSSQAVSARQHYDQYFKAGGKDPKVSLQYALDLEKNHELDKSIFYLTYSIRHESKDLSLAAHSELIKILMSQKKYAEADQVIRKFWSKSKVAQAYFVTEENQIQSQLPRRKTRSIASRR